MMTTTEEECPICSETISDSVVPSDCQHSFCKKCILSWCNVKPSCPICRTEIKWLLDSAGEQCAVPKPLDWEHVENLTTALLEQLVRTVARRRLPRPSPVYYDRTRFDREEAAAVLAVLRTPRSSDRRRRPPHRLHGQV
jgi:hypothetical protein